MKKQIRNAVYFILGILGLGSSSAMACVEMNLCIDGIDGESKSKNHPNCIEVLAWSWGLSNSSSAVGGGGGSGQTNVQDLSVTKWIDKSTPILMSKVADRTSVTKAELFVERCGEQGLTPYFELDMSNVIFTSLSTGGSGGEARLTENVTLNFQKVQWCYTAPDGKAEPCGEWDVVIQQ